MLKKQAIVLVSFGTSEPEAKASCLDTVTADVRKDFPDYDVFEAWTSSFLMKKAAKAGTKMKSFGQVLAELRLSGYERILVQPTHLTDGEEFNNKIIPEIEANKSSFRELKLGKPVLAGTGPESYEGLLDRVLPLKELSDGEELVMMGHGSPNRHNAVYEWLQACADRHGLPIHIGVVEDTDWPNRDMVLARLKKKGVSKVYLCPLLLTCGDHARNDMAGDDPDSWKNVIAEQGIKVRADYSGLGEKTSFRALYISSLKEMANS